MHQINDLLDYGQSQARTAFLFSWRTIDLLKRLENGRLLVLWYADAAVFNCELPACCQGRL